MKASRIFLVAILAGVLFAGCLSEGANNDQSEIKNNIVIPKIKLLSPVTGGTYTDVVEIRWQTNDASNPARINIYYTTDPKPFCPTCPPQEWHEIASGVENNGIYLWDTSDYPPSDLYMIKIKLITSDRDVENTSGNAFTIK